VPVEGGLVLRDAAFEEEVRQCVMSAQKVAASRYAAVLDITSFEVAKSDAAVCKSLFELGG